jgi:enamine deaminase RidA (YjgF/YER057c/UK114 family)
MPERIMPKSLGAPLGMYSHGMVAPAGDIVVVAGQTGIDGAGNLAGAEVGPQTKQALENVRAVIEAAGCTMRDIVRLQTFLVNARDIADYMKARSEVFPRYFPDGAYPPNTLLIVSRLVRPELSVEIEAMAVRPSRASAARRRPAAKPARAAKTARRKSTGPRIRSRR